MPFLTIPELAKKYHWSDRTIRKYMHDWPPGTVIQVGHGYRIDEEKFLANASVTGQNTRRHDGGKKLSQADRILAGEV